MSANPLPYRAGGVDAVQVGPARNRVDAEVALPVGIGVRAGASTSPGTGEVASPSEPERAPRPRTCEPRWTVKKPL
jgi:hypothetical protein